MSRFITFNLEVNWYWARAGLDYPVNMFYKSPIGYITVGYTNFIPDKNKVVFVVNFCVMGVGVCALYCSKPYNPTIINLKPTWLMHMVDTKIHQCNDYSQRF